MRRRLDLARQPGRPAAGAVPRRADHRARPAQPHRAVGRRPRSGRRRGDGAAHHAVPGGGRPAGRRHRRHRPRPGDRHRHPRRAQGDAPARTSRGPAARGRTSGPVVPRWSARSPAPADGRPDRSRSAVGDRGLLPAVVRRWTTSGCASPSWRCAGRASTRCSWRSPAAAAGQPDSEARPTGAGGTMTTMTHARADLPAAPPARPGARRPPAAEPDAGLAEPGPDQAQPVGADRPLSIQPIMFVLLFTLRVRRRDLRLDGDYLQFALPGLIVQNALFVTLSTAHRAQHRPDQGRVRPAAQPADRALGPAVRPDRGRRLKQAWAMVLLLGVGMIARFPGGHDPARGGRGGRPAARVRAGVLVDLGAGRGPGVAIRRR